MDDGTTKDSGAFLMQCSCFVLMHCPPNRSDIDKLLELITKKDNDDDDDDDNENDDDDDANKNDTSDDDNDDDDENDNVRFARAFRLTECDRSFFC
jgi:hypothetical protein